MAGEIRENKAELDGQIKKIAKMTADILPDGWEKAAAGYFLTGEDEAEQLQVTAVCEDEEDYRDVSADSWDDGDLADALLDIGEEFAALHSLCRKAGDNWSEATLVISRSGRFEMKFVYEPVTEYDNFFLDEWKSRYLA